MVKEGEIAKVGAGLCLIEVEEEESESDSKPAPDASKSSSSAVESQPTAMETLPPPLPTSDGPAPTRRLHPLDPQNASKGTSVGMDKVYAAPSVRYFARQNGVDLTLLVPGSGKDGRIEKRDVEAAISGSRQVAEQYIPTSHTQQNEDVVVELGRTRYGMWKAMVKVRHSSLDASCPQADLYKFLTEPGNSSLWVRRVQSIILHLRSNYKHPTVIQQPSISQLYTTSYPLSMRIYPHITCLRHRGHPPRNLLIHPLYTLHHQPAHTQTHIYIPN